MRCKGLLQVNLSTRVFMIGFRVWGTRLRHTKPRQKVLLPERTTAAISINETFTQGEILPQLEALGPDTQTVLKVDPLQKPHLPLGTK